MSIVENLVGKTLTKITGMESGGEEIVFTCSDGSVFLMHHDQDCCECVRIEDVCGDVSDLLGTPILGAEERTHFGGDKPVPDWAPTPKCPDSWTWTFYEFCTIKGSVTLRWLGESNGYYSESVDFREMPRAPERLEEFR